MKKIVIIITSVVASLIVIVLGTTIVLNIDYKNNEDYHWKNILFLEINKDDHDFEDWVIEKPKTCIEDGHKTRKCKTCGYVESTIIEKGHVYSSNWVIDIEPTCTDSGLKSMHCTAENCNAVYKETVVPALGHDEEIIEAVSPTLTSNGLTQGIVCKRCEEIIKEQISTPKLYELNLEISYEYAGIISQSDYIAQGGNIVYAHASENRGYTFDGWYVDGKLVSNELFYSFEMPEMNYTLYAKFDPIEFKVFYANTDLDNGFVKFNEKVAKPSNPVKDLHDFVGWFADEACEIPYNFDSVARDDITLYAKFQLRKYTISFNEYGIDDQIIVEGELAVKPKEPSKAGLNFIGWYLEPEHINLYNFNDPVYDNICLYSRFEQKQYIATFSDESIDNQIITHGEKVLEPLEPLKEGYNFIGWYLDSKYITLYNFNNPVYSNIQLYAKFEPKEFKVIYMNTDLDCEIIKYDDKIIKPKNPTKELHNFIGWYTDEECTVPYDFDSIVKGDVILYSKFELRTYIVSFSEEGIEDQIIGESYKAIKPADPLKEGYYFDGWYSDSKFDNEFDFNNSIYSNINLYAKFSKFKVSVIEAEGLNLSFNESEYCSGDNVSIYVEIEPGYEFNGWFIDGVLLSNEMILSFEMPKRNLMIETNSNEIMYSMSVVNLQEDAGSILKSNDEYTVNDAVSISYFLNSGYEFIGWFENDTLLSSNLTYEFTSEPRNIEIHARTKAIKYNVTVTSTTGGSTSTNGGLYTVNDLLYLSAEESKNYDFIGWYINDNLYSNKQNIQISNILNDINIEARFEQAYLEIEVISDLNGKVYGSKTILKDTSSLIVAIPNKGYRFDGWYVNDELVSTNPEYSNIYNFSGKIVYFAKFTNSNPVVTFYPNNGEEPWEEEVTDSYLLPYSYKEGYTFDGWYLDNGTWSNKVTNNISRNYIVYAKYNQIGDYKEIQHNLKEDLVVSIYSRLDINDTNINDYVKLTDSDNNICPITVINNNNGYYTLVYEYDKNETYHYEIINNDVFFINGMKEFAFSFERDEASIIEYNTSGNVHLVYTDQIQLVNSTENMMVLKTDEVIKIDDIIYVINGENSRAVYVSEVYAEEDNYILYYKPDEVDGTLVVSNIDVNNDNLVTNMEDATIEGDTDAAMEAFSQIVYETASVDSLRRSLNKLQKNDKTFTFEDPKINHNFSINKNEISIKVEIMVKGTRKVDDKDAETFSIRIQAEIKNEITSSCDFNINVFLLKIKKFEYVLRNKTTVNFNVDLIYNDSSSETNFDALEILLRDYKESLSEKKELPFDTNSKYENIFNDFVIKKSFMIPNTIICIEFKITPFIRYKVIGQMDFNTEFTVTNECVLAYTKGEFKLFYNNYADKDITIYALAYLNMEVGVNAQVDINIAGLNNLIDIGAIFEAGPYVTASGALIYEDEDLELSGFIEWGYFYDWEIYLKVLTKRLSYNPDKVIKPLGDIGDFYLYLEFVNEKDSFEVNEYSIDIYRYIDHEVYAFDLKELAPTTLTSIRDDYSYVLEDNDYIYINELNHLKVRQMPSTELELTLWIYAGSNIVKEVILTFDIKENIVSFVDNSYGTYKASKLKALTGELITIEFKPKTITTMIDYWLINGEKLESTAQRISIEMVDNGLTIEVVTSEMENVTFIYTIDDFDKIRNNRSGTYIQMNDLDFEGSTVGVIGTVKEGYFTGRYYGNGYKILNFNRNYSGTSDKYNYFNVSIFGFCKNAYFNNLRIENISYECTLTAYRPSVGSAKNSIYSGIISTQSENCEFIDCYIENATINHVIKKAKRSFCYGDNDNYIVIGGITAYGINVKIENCIIKNFSASTNITGWDSEEGVVGGFIGCGSESVIVQNSYCDIVINSINSGAGSSSIWNAGVVGSINQSTDVTLRNSLINVKSNIIDSTNSKYYFSNIIATNTASCSYDISNVYYVTNDYEEEYPHNMMAQSITSKIAYSNEFIYVTLGLSNYS